MKEARKSILYLDNLRASLVVLVIVHHIAITYGAPGGWFYHEKAEETLLTSISLTLLVSVSQAFFMGLLFFIAGFFSPGAYGRKGASRFIWERFVRLGIPIIFYVIFFNPYLQYQGLASAGESNVSYIDFWRQSLTTPQLINIGPLWFLEALLVFSVAYALWQKYVPQAEGAPTQALFPSNKRIVALALALAVITGTIRLFYQIGDELFFLQLAFFPQYVAFFIAGMRAYRHGWLNHTPDVVLKFWHRILLVMLFLWPVLLIAGGALTGNIEPFEGGLYWQSFSYATWEMFLGIAMSIVLINLFRVRFEGTGRVWAALSESSYTMYIIHAAVVVAFTRAVADIRIFPLAKFTIVAPLAVLLIFLLSYVIRELPYVKKVL